MDLKINANHKGYKEIKTFADSKNMSIRDVMVSEEHLDSVVDILYKNMPKTIRWILNRDKFKQKYLDQRDLIANIFDGVNKK